MQLHTCSFRLVVQGMQLHMHDSIDSSIVSAPRVACVLMTSECICMCASQAHSAS